MLLRLLAFRPMVAGGAGASAPAAAAPAAPDHIVPLRSDATRRVASAVIAPLALPPAALPAAIAPAPATRVPPPGDEPPPWLEVPFDSELDEPAAQVAREPAPPPFNAAATGFTPTALGERWAGLVRVMVEAGAISAFARELAMQAQCVGLDESVVPVVCRLIVDRESLRAAAPCEKLQAALAEALDRPVRLEVEAGAADDSPARRDAAERARRQAEAEQIIHDDPLVRALMAQYKTARIVPGSVKPH